MKKKKLTFACKNPFLTAQCTQWLIGQPMYFLTSSSLEMVGELIEAEIKWIQFIKVSPQNHQSRSAKQDRSWGWQSSQSSLDDLVTNNINKRTFCVINIFERRHQPLGGGRGHFNHLMWNPWKSDVKSDLRKFLGAIIWAQCSECKGRTPARWQTRR